MIRIPAIRRLGPLGLIVLCLSLARASAQVERVHPPILLDMGAPESPVAEGYSRVTAADGYDPRKGYGFLTKDHHGFHLAPPRSDPNSWRLRKDVHYKDHATPLLVDGIRSRHEMKFRVDVPPAAYRVTVSLGDLMRSMGSLSLFANGELIEKNIAFQHGVYRQICGSNKANRGSSGVYGFTRRIRFTLKAPEGTLVIRLAADPSDYDRLLALEKKKAKPISWAAGRALKGAVPPYEDIGEPFVDIPFLGLEIRKYQAPPVAMPEHGRLEYSGNSAAVRKAIPAFNEGRFADAESALDADSAKNDPLAAGLTYLYLAGWPPYDQEARLVPKARTLIDRALAASPAPPAAVEAHESLDLFARALALHRGRGEPGKNHFVENVRACHLFRSIPPGDPLYWKSFLHAARTALQLDPHRWATSGRTALKWMARIRERFPRNRHAVYYLTDRYDEQSGPWALPDYGELHRAAPAWAARLHEAYDLILNLSEWWIRNKQKADGSIGGGWGDDVELVGLFGYYAFISDGASPLARKGAVNLVNGMYVHSGDIEPESGYIWHAADSEHSAEWTGDTLPMMMLLEYGNPLWIERGMASAKLMRDLWTGVNARGHRHFRANFIGGLGVGRGDQANDSAINRRCIFPAERVLWYNRHPGIERLIVEWAAAWAEDAMRTDKGKPRGFIPGDVAYEDCEIGGKGAPAWYQAKRGRGTVNYDFGGYHAYHLGLLRAAAELTGDPKYLEPIRLEAEAYGKMANVREDINAPAGSPEKIKSVLRAAHGAWAEIRGSRAKGGRRSGPPGATYEQVVERCEEVVTLIRKRWPVMTTEASATDRVAFPGIVTPFRLYSGGTGSSLATLSISATYRGVGRDFAAFITESTPTRLSLRFYAFRDGAVDLEVLPWGLEMGGAYKVTVAPDADDAPDPEGREQAFTLSQRGQACPIRVAGRTSHVIRFVQVKKGRGQRPTADLSVGEGDIEYSHERGYLTVRIHNTGTAAAREVPVVIYEGTPGRGRKIGRGLISHLEWPRDLVPMTLKLGWRYTPSASKAAFTVVVDPGNAVVEITELNNRASRTIRFDGKNKKARPTPP